MKKASKSDTVCTRIQSPIGPLTLVASKTGLREVRFGRTEKVSRQLNSVLRKAKQELQEYFKGTRTRFDVPLELEGTEFQKKVWKSLCKIPFGLTISYREQARELGSPKAVRAVAAANGKNPLAVILPCHRVIASSGKLQGYSGGLSRKAKLLRLEARPVC